MWVGGRRAEGVRVCERAHRVVVRDDGRDLAAGEAEAELRQLERAPRARVQRVVVRALAIEAPLPRAHATRVRLAARAVPARTPHTLATNSYAPEPVTEREPVNVNVNRQNERTARAA